MEFSRQEYKSGLPCPPPGDLPNPGIEPTSLKSPALAGGLFTTSTTWEAEAFFFKARDIAMTPNLVWGLPPLGPCSTGVNQSQQENQLTQLH